MRQYSVPPLSLVFTEQALRRVLEEGWCLFAVRPAVRGAWCLHPFGVWNAFGGQCLGKVPIHSTAHNTEPAKRLVGIQCPCYIGYLQRTQCPS